MQQRICLSMIVKNEIDVIERCLRSVAPFIDHWIIVDTGSTDGTMEKIEEVMKDLGISGHLYSDEWVDFATNRTKALLRVDPDEFEYIFTIDADEELILPKDYKPPHLTSPSYYMTMQYGESEYKRLSLINTKYDWRYVGVIHEYLTSSKILHHDSLSGPTVFVHPDTSDVTEKYRGHARILEEVLQKEPNNTRYMFYLAQSYFDCKEYEKSYEWYKKRAETGEGWNEEIWFSFYRLGIIAERLKKEEEEVFMWYMKAYNTIPSRAAEAFGQLTLYLNVRKVYNLSGVISRIAANCIKPKDGLFVNHSWYDWRAKWEHALTCYHLKNYEEAIRIWQELSLNSKVDDHTKSLCQTYIAATHSKMKS